MRATTTPLCSFFDYASETYQLAAAVHVDMETLLAGGQSEIVVRAALTLNGERLPLTQLQRVRLHIQTQHGDGLSSSQVVDDVQLEAQLSWYIHSLCRPDCATFTSHSTERCQGVASTTCRPSVPLPTSPSARLSKRTSTCSQVAEELRERWTICTCATAVTDTPY